jgi:hypothetical protein
MPGGAFEKSGPSIIIPANLSGMCGVSRAQKLELAELGSLSYSDKIARLPREGLKFRLSEVF